MNLLKLNGSFDFLAFCVLAVATTTSNTIKTSVDRLDRYPSCANDKTNLCENKCTDVRDPCYMNGKESQNATWVSWHASKSSDDVELGHLTSPLDELTVVSEVNGDEEKLEMVFKGEEPQDIMQVDVLLNINFIGQMAIKIDKILKYIMAIPEGKMFGLSVG